MDNSQPRQGNIVVGVMLVLIGAALLMNRTGVISLTGGVTLWPLILVGLGLARFVQTPPGYPRQGLLLMLAGVWLFMGQAGWLTLSESWPFIVIAFGIAVALNSGSRSRRLDTPSTPDDGTLEGWHHHRHRGLTPLAVVGIWIAIAVAARVSGVGSIVQSDSRDTVHVFSVMGRSEHTSHAEKFQNAELTNVMGRSELDLREATIPRGGEASVEVFSVMGGAVIRVPRDWVVDSQALSVMGAIRDDRFGPQPEPGTSSEDLPAPRLVLRGMVMMGALVIRS